MPVTGDRATGTSRMVRVGWMRAAVVAASIVVTVVSQTAVVAADPTGGAAATGWQQTADAPPQYPNVAVDWDVPITMSDGIVLKANVYRPADAQGRPVDADLPAILDITPYTKLVTSVLDAVQAVPGVEDVALKWLSSLNFDGTPFDGITDITQGLDGGVTRIFGVNRDLVRSGYAHVVVDARGTGFSQGSRDVLGPREQQDSAEIIDWMSRQPWSDGKVGMTGLSYSAINSVQAAALAPSALKATFPVEPSNDLLRDIVGTGGALGVGFMPFWLAGVNGAKFLPDVQSILQGRFDWKWLQGRTDDPVTLIPEVINALTAPSIPAITPQTLNAAQDGPFYETKVADVANITAPTFVYGGWHDIFAGSETGIYNEMTLPPGQKQLMMGDGYHINPGLNFGDPGTPPRLDVLQRAWFDKWLKGIDNGIDSYGPVTLQQQGGGWTTSEAFPRPGAEHQRVYLSAAPSGTGGHSAHDGSLSGAATPDVTRVTVAPGLRGICSRDAAQGTAGAGAFLGSACAEDSRFQEGEGLTFTSAPVDRSSQISGPVAVHLETVLDTADGFWAVTLNDVAPDGRSTVLSSGSLTASLRDIDDAKSTFSANGDYSNPVPELTLATRRPVVPGERTPVDISLTPTDAVLAPGHRLRIDVYASSVPRYLPLGPMLTDSRLAPQHLLLDPAAPSYANVPFVTPA